MSSRTAFERAQQVRSTKDLPEDFFEQLATVEDAAALAGVTSSTVHNWITRGYVDRFGQRRWLLGFHVQGVRMVIPLDVLRADAEVHFAGRGGLRKRAM